MTRTTRNGSRRGERTWNLTGAEVPDWKLESGVWLCSTSLTPRGGGSYIPGFMCWSLKNWRTTRFDHRGQGPTGSGFGTDEHSNEAVRVAEPALKSEAGPATSWPSSTDTPAQPTQAKPFKRTGTNSRKLDGCFSASERTPAKAEETAQDHVAELIGEKVVKGDREVGEG